MREFEVLDLPNEVWRPIVGYEGHYMVSNMGRVKSLSRSITTKAGVVKPCKSSILRPCIRGGYCAVILSVNGKSNSMTIHRAVATSFIPNPEGKPCVNHKDLNKLNNRLVDLEWCTHLENIRHAYLNGAMSNSIKYGPKLSVLGEKNPNCKLSDTQVRGAVLMYNNRGLTGLQLDEIAKKFNIHPKTLMSYVKGRYRKEATNGL